MTNEEAIQCEDAISRQEVQDLMATWIKDQQYNDKSREILEVIDEKIEDMPSVQPKQRTGRWEHGVCCGCGFDWGKVAPITNVTPYCPSCGAKMEVEEKSCSNCKFWCLDRNDENRRCKYCYRQDEWQAESEDKE